MKGQVSLAGKPGLLFVILRPAAGESVCEANC